MCADLSQTANHQIFVEHIKTIPGDWVRTALERLDEALKSQLSPEELICFMKELVDTYRSPEEYNSIRAFAEEERDLQQTH